MVYTNDPDGKYEKFVESKVEIRVNDLLVLQSSAVTISFIINEILNEQREKFGLPPEEN
jgi:hypothetical protein